MLMGVQCDGWTGHWAYTVNTGSASNVKPHWVSRAVPPAIRGIGPSTNGTMYRPLSQEIAPAMLRTTQFGWMGTRRGINAKVLGAADLGWGDVINTQFQVDGYGSSGSVTAYVDGMKVSAW